MISLDEIGRKKPQIGKSLATQEPSYDHARQRRWDEVDTSKVYMKSSTSFDGESDQGGEDN